MSDNKFLMLLCSNGKIPNRKMMKANILTIYLNIFFDELFRFD